MSWAGDPPPRHGPFSLAERWRILRRGIPLAVLVFGGLAVLVLVRLAEAPLFGQRRPVTPSITRFVCRNAFRIMGMGWRAEGVPLRGAGAVVANHSTWLDIFALNAGDRVYFVSKAEVADWPGIGWLARATGTVFIRRNPREAHEHVDTFRRRLAAGHRLVFFPEGTSTDGRRILPFKTTLFAAFLDPDLRATLMIQPVSVTYVAPSGKDPRFLGWWGAMDFAPHLARVLAARRPGEVQLVYHPGLAAADFNNRKQLAGAAETAVRSGFAGEAVEHARARRS
jgi:1-acyl-sn-glycerol-3-phosphate acyltransferase